MKKQHPPTSVRYCAHCKDETRFKYDRNIGHSRCTECGWHYIPSLDPMGMYAKEKEEFAKMREEAKETPEYKETSRQQEIIKAKIKHIQMLAPKTKYKLLMQRRTNERY